MKPLNCRSQAAPSPAACRSSSATLPSSEVDTNAAEPSGKALPGGQVGVEVLEAAPVELVLQLAVGGASP